MLDGLILMGVPVAAGIAILKYRLYDIDVIINRTLVYGTLTALLAAIYLGSVVLLQQIVSPLIGGNDQITMVASTLAIAALFQPLRRRIQTVIDACIAANTMRKRRSRRSAPGCGTKPIWPTSATI